MMYCCVSSVRKALAIWPEQRFPNAHALAEALLVALTEGNKQNISDEVDNGKLRRVHVRKRRTLFSRTQVPVKASEWSKIK